MLMGAQAWCAKVDGLLDLTVCRNERIVSIPSSDVHHISRYPSPIVLELLSAKI